MKGKIICINASLHRVMLEDKTILDTKTRGKLRNNDIHPVVGDNVIVNVNTKTIIIVGASICAIGLLVYLKRKFKIKIVK